MNVHFVWSTTERRALLDAAWNDRLYSYIGAVVAAKKGRLIAAGGQPDHIHLYLSMPSTLSLAAMVNTIKSNSSRWIRGTFSDRRKFGWQEGYGAFSVSKSSERAVIDYIANQEWRHKGQDFKQEFVELLKRHAISYDPRYLWI